MHFAKTANGVCRDVLEATFRVGYYSCPSSQRDLLCGFDITLGRYEGTQIVFVGITPVNPNQALREDAVESINDLIERALKENGRLWDKLGVPYSYNCEEFVPHRPSPILIDLGPVKYPKIYDWRGYQHDLGSVGHFIVEADKEIREFIARVQAFVFLHIRALPRFKDGNILLKKWEVNNPTYIHRSISLFFKTAKRSAILIEQMQQEADAERYVAIFVPFNMLVTKAMDLLKGYDHHKLRTFHYMGGLIELGEEIAAGHVIAVVPVFFEDHEQSYRLIDLIPDIREHVADPDQYLDDLVICPSFDSSNLKECTLNEHLVRHIS